jgi:hypothetical protein
MDCSQCYNFIQTKSQKDLGDITDNKSCAYCLYWNVGPGNRISNCNCNNMFMEITNNGRTFNINSYEKVKKCLENTENIECCKDLYTQFTTPSEPITINKKFTGYHNRSKITQINNSCNDTKPYGYYLPCTNKVASPGFYKEGVL